MKRKGITPIIAIVVLLLIVVALSSLAYTYISGIAQGQIEGSFLVQIGSESCNGKNVTFIVKNTGVTSSLAIGDFLVATVTNSTGGSYNLQSVDFSVEPIPAQGTSIVTTGCGDMAPGSGCGTGVMTIRLSTGVTTAPPVTVTC